MALDKDVHGDGERDQVPAIATTSTDYRWRSPDEIDAMTDEEYAAWERAWVEEICRRGDEAEAGLGKTYSLEEVMADAYAIINAR
jgi:hypothetical protein